MAEATTDRSWHAEYMAQKRAGEREIRIGHPAQPERRLACEKDVYQFLPTYFAELFWGPWTADRRDMVESILGAARRGIDKAIAAPRGTGKTAITECVTIYAVLIGEIRFPMIMACTGELADGILANIKEYFEANELLYADFPEVCGPIRALDGMPNRCNGQHHNSERTRMKWSGNSVRFPSLKVTEFCGQCYGIPEKCRCKGGPALGWTAPSAGAVISSRGLDAATRGLRKGVVRPDLVVIDDPETEESAASAVQIAKREATIERALAGMGGPGKKIARVLLTTIQRAGSLSARMVSRDKKPAWHGIKYRFFEAWPDRSDMWEEYLAMRDEDARQGTNKAHEMYAEHRAEMDRGAIVSDESRYEDGKELSAIQHGYNWIARIGLDSFRTEFQNDPPQEHEPEQIGITISAVQKKLSGLNRYTAHPSCNKATVAIDVGKWKLHWTTTAWKDDATGYIVDYGEHAVTQLDAENPKAVELAILQALRELREDLKNSVAKPEGELLPLDLVLIDSGYYTQAVYSFCKESGPRWKPFKGFGDSVDGANFFRSSSVKSTKDKVVGDHWFHVPYDYGRLVGGDADYWKTAVHERFMASPETSGSLVLFGADYREHYQYAQQITAEIQLIEFIPDKGLKTYWKKERKQNHWLDSTYMACIAASMLNVQVVGMPRQQTKRAAAKRMGPRLLNRPGGWIKGMR